jgi:hypothetical protein
MKDKKGNLIHRPKGSCHKPVWLTSHQAKQLYEFCDDFSAEYNKYTGGNSTAILIALQRVIENDLEE